MTRRVSAMLVRKNLAELLEGVSRSDDEVIVERAGKPMGVLISMSQYERIQRQRVQALAALEQVWARANPEPGDLAVAEGEILRETESVRHGAAA